MKEKNLFPPNNQLANFTRYCVLTLICRFLSVLNARYTLKQHYVCFIQQTCKVTLHSSLLGNYFQNDYNFRNNIVTVLSQANAKAIRVFALKANLTSGAKQYLASWICPCGPNFPSAILRIRKKKYLIHTPQLCIKNGTCLKSFKNKNILLCFFTLTSAYNHSFSISC